MTRPSGSVGPGGGRKAAGPRRCGAAIALVLLPALALPTPAAAQSRAALVDCRLEGVAHTARCGKLLRPLDPAAPGGVQIELHFAMVPALARQPQPDPVVFLAGGPGQSAIDLAGPLSRLFAALAYRRDLVFVDQRGTGRSAPLACPQDASPPPARPLAESLDRARQLTELRDCRDRLKSLPHGDLRQYTTPIASADLDAVRAALGAERLDLVGASYGTRAALDYMRQFPQRVRRVVLDGAAPPDMALPAAARIDGQAAFDALLARCEADADCARLHPDLRGRWQALLDSLPREVTVTHPYSGRDERITLTRDMLLGLRRAPLYLPALAAGLPHALDQAARAGRFGPLLALAAAGPAVNTVPLASGMHFSVICAEDLPRVSDATLRDADGALAQYREACEGWPRGELTAAFYTLPRAPVATLVLSGELDPATPPRHGERVAAALGAKARHVVAPGAAHGVMAQPCGPELVQRFINAADDAAALAADTGCLLRLPPPTLFVPPGEPAP
jgi:pimeloyl-ACP methyl ester carboxylesterase